MARLAAKAEAAGAPHGSEHHLHMRLPPITHREGSPTLAPALQVASQPHMPANAGKGRSCNHSNNLLWGALLVIPLS